MTAAVLLTINYSQLVVLTKFMEEQPDFARKLLKTVADWERLWKDLADAINRKGPPVRSVTEWKKVWVDYKYRVKMKLLHNKKCPDKQKSLNRFEQSVANSTGLKNALLGTAAAKSFDCRISFQSVDTGCNPQTNACIKKGNVKQQRQALGRKPIKTKIKQELLARFIDATEESNKIQRNLLRLEEESLKLKRKSYELETTKWYLNGT
ncbi:uncharacterized protein LOC129718838 [Wyeomyia smithii]|uniref:uncharacterized protein LOC129718838 n=1 Tax=Wyeomyia smithii TaxID=174621 RepID=UPI002467F18E|nr:uncharacterized protein LOC129718838 [Wyeomyia smithii]